MIHKFLFLLLIFTISINGYAQQDQAEIAAVEKVCNFYLEGGTNGDSVMFAKAFHPGGQMMFMRNDTVRIVSLKDFTARMRHTLQKQDRKTKIESIEVYGNAAVAKLTVEYPGFYFHDIMSLLKTDEGWKITGKIFYREEKK